MEQNMGTHCPLEIPAFWQLHLMRTAENLKKKSLEEPDFFLH